jgi:hypothetical protein
MGYYVLGEQGQKYGPADLATLNEWVTEGRVLPGTMLEDATSGARVMASSVAGLRFAQSPPQSPTANPGFAQPPQYRPQQYQTTNSGGDQSQFALALIMAIISPLLSFFLPIGGLFTGLIGIRTAIRVKDAGHPMGILVIVLNVLALAFWVITRVTGIGRGMFLR